MRTGGKNPEIDHLRAKYDILDQTTEDQGQEFAAYMEAYEECNFQSEGK